ncbi:phage tail tape measure protein [Hymenobacter pini]|uniref:phage tail tape measure protein n=1 Tax=Hymenobacter pini TaxID=2880879 RepID=UPI001CF398E5|nr:phage tail tape measure protein [Hymenobacter pini]MCA8831979.1 phage tail tape measure protein [Hymenobacter pini]
MAGETEKRTVEIVVNGQKVNASLKEMDAAAAVLYNQFRKLSADDPGRAKLLQDYRDMKERIGDVRKELGQVKESTNVFQQAMAFAGVSVGTEAIIDGIKELGAEVLQTTKEVQTLRANINSMTGAAGAELDGLTSSVMAVARTFGKDFNEVLVASNSLSKTMGVSQQEAMRLIEQGFLSGADASGEFLDQVKEYGPQFKSAGLSAQEAIGVISQSVTGGIFSDKGADVVKEFGLRIREQTKSTKDAMYAAFGPEFTKEILDGVNSGSLSSVEALRRVSKEMNDTKIPASQLQTVIADVFGGPGEDAGLDYLKSLQNVGTGVDQLVDKTNVYVQRQRAQLLSEKELADSQNALAKSFEGGSTIMSTMTNKAMTVLYTLLTSLGATFKEVFQPVQDVWASLMKLAESMGWVSKEGITAKGVGEALGRVINWMLTPTKLLWGALADITRATVEWAMKSENARAVLTLMTAPIRGLFALLTNGPAYFAGFSTAAETSFGVIGRAWQHIKDRDFSGAADEFAKIGTDAGEAFNRAFEQATASKSVVEVSASATSEDGGLKPLRKSGGTGQTEADEDKAEKERKARLKRVADAQDKADQARLDALKKQVALEEKLENARVAAIEDGHEREIQEVLLKYRRKAALVTGSEQEQQAQLLAIREAQDRELQALSEKYQKEADDNQKKRFEQRLAEQDAADQARQEEIQAQFEEALVTEAQRDEALYWSKRMVLEAKLALEEAYSGKTTDVYRKTFREMQKLDTDHTKEAQKSAEDRAKAMKQFQGMMMKTQMDALQLTLDILGRDEQARKKNAGLIRNFTVAKLVLDGAQEIQGIWTDAAQNPFWKLLPPGASVAYAAARTALAAVRTGFAISQVKGVQFADGGRTGAGIQAQGGMRVTPMGQLMEASGVRVGPSGKLVDSTGHNVAGIVHDNEYVIPKWMRQDPQVLAVENWLEAKRLRGYAQGGPTAEGANSLALAMSSSLLNQDSQEWQRQMLDVLQQLSGRLQGVESWATRLGVDLNLLQLEREQQTLVQVRQDSAIRKGR